MLCAPNAGAPVVKVATPADKVPVPSVVAPSLKLTVPDGVPQPERSVAVKLRAVRRGPETPARFREQFALTFDVPDGSPVRSEVMPVTHPTIGEHNLLVTQVIDSVHPTSLEICFS